MRESIDCFLVLGALRHEGVACETSRNGRGIMKTVTDGPMPRRDLFISQSTRELQDGVKQSEFPVASFK